MSYFLNIDLRSFNSSYSSSFSSFSSSFAASFSSFVTSLNSFFHLNISKYPEPLQSILRIIQIKGALAAPEAMMKGMEWVYKQEEEYMPEYLLNEINGIADGMCAKLQCNATEWRDTIRYVNMLPEVVFLSLFLHLISDLSPQSINQS